MAQTYYHIDENEISLVKITSCDTCGIAVLLHAHDVQSCPIGVEQWGILPATGALHFDGPGTPIVLCESCQEK